MFEDRFDVDPRGSGGESDQDSPEAQPIGDAGSVASERMIGRFRQERFDGSEDRVHHFGLECAHDVG